ncbi:MAG: (Fe-S)-binding protein [Chromatiales bacterium]|jgi:Fe-S oxidoreductase
MSAVDLSRFSQFREGIAALANVEYASVLTDEQRVDRAKQVFWRKIDKTLAMDLESCIHCGHCASACHFHESTGDAKYTPIRKLDLMKRFYRRELSPLRWLHRLYTRDINVADLSKWQELVYDSCTECGRCSQVCPMGINIANGVNVMREALAQADLMPTELAVVEREQCGQSTVFGFGTDQFMQGVESMRAQGIEIPVDKEKADVLVLSTVVDMMLFNDSVMGTIRIMNHLGLNWTFSSSNFEAANFGLLSGYEGLQKSASDGIINKAKEIGASMVIVPECGHAYPALRWDGPNEYGQELPFEVLAISEFLGREVEAGRLKLKNIGKSKKVTMHDPCKVARHSGVIDEPRAVLNALGVDFTETESSREVNWCCGGGAGVFLINRASDLRQKAFGIKMDQVNATGADSVVMSCGSCRLNFLNGADKANWDKQIESLVALAAENIAD